jgi:protein-S-isoprenylcysteine O-methyltransferase Ste14
MLILRSIFFTFLLPGTVTVLIPYWINRGGEKFVDLGPLHYLGLPLIVIGAAGLLWCIWQFFSEGRGTLAPVDPPKELVVHGPYRVVRNPMYVSVVSMLIGEAVWFGSRRILIEAAIFFGLSYLFILFYEEPYLGWHFGPTYEAYVKTTGRWLPRIRRRSP